MKKDRINNGHIKSDHIKDDRLNSDHIKNDCIKRISYQIYYIATRLVTHTVYCKFMHTRKLLKIFCYYI
jgi:hypothetical protein